MKKVTKRCSKKLTKKDRLNRHLCPDKFEICVPKTCRLLGWDWTQKCDWKNYLELLNEEINGKCEVPRGYECPPTCWSCDGKEGWKLTGDLAVAHACRVHEKIHRQVLSLDQVNAIDVGFAISETQSLFEQFLAIRVHVNKKMPPEQILRAGLVSFTEAGFALESVVAPSKSVNPFDPFGGVFLNAFGPDVVRANAVSPLQSASGSPFRPEAGHRRSKPQNPDPRSTEPSDCCSASERCDEDRKEQLKRLFLRHGSGVDSVWSHFLDQRYPINGVTEEDLSIFCPRSIEETRSLDDVRLCLCGVPIDIINAQYRPAITHPGGDADSGVFADPPKRSNELSRDELLLIGRGRANPMVGGVSVGSVTGQAGTLGTIVWDRTDGTPCILSNWHVLAGSTAAQVGQPVYQPALFDGGTGNDVVGHLKRWRLGEAGDAALAELAGNRHYASDEILGLWHPISGSVKPRLNMEIRKWGRTTGFTRGFVDGIQLATNIDYGDGVFRYFRDQFHIAPSFRGQDVSQVGDSGSVVVTSFSPVKQEERLRLLSRWLVACCDAHGLPSLCVDIKCGVCRLIEESMELEGELSKPDCSGEGSADPSTWSKILRLLCKIKLGAFCSSEGGECPLETAFSHLPTELRAKLEKAGLLATLQETDEDDSTQGTSTCFCCYLAGRYERVRSICREHREKVELYRDGYDRLKRLYTKCSQCEISSQTACEEARYIVANLGICDGKIQHCCEPEIHSICDQIVKALQCVETELKKEQKRLDFCIKVREAFRCWHRRCCDISKGQEVCSQICDALEGVRSCVPGSCQGEGCDGQCKSVPCLSPKCASLQGKDLDCVDPALLVRCIQAAIGKVEPAGCPKPSQPEQQPSGKYPIATVALEGTEQPDPHKPSACSVLVAELETDQDQLDACLLESMKKLLGQEPNKWFSDILEKQLGNGVLRGLLERELSENDVIEALVDNIRNFLDEQEDESDRNTVRAYYAVGMIFAGDTPGSPLGEFAVASDIERLAETLRFSLRPVFEPRSSFRELRERPQLGSSGRARRRRGRRGLAPGDLGSDPRDSGPTPQPRTDDDNTSDGGG